MKRFFLALGVSLLAFALPDVVLAAEFTAENADRLSLESNTLISTSVGALSFFLGWVAGSSL